MKTPSSIGQDELLSLQTICDDLGAESGVHLVALLHRDGQMLVNAGDSERYDLTSLAALSAGSMAGARGMAELINEDDFIAIVHEGQHEKILLWPVEKSAILVVHFDNDRTLGYIKYRVRRQIHELSQKVEDLLEKFRQNDPRALAISDDDFDTLHFGGL